MIQAVIFDLDGTLVQTERLKAHSYAQAVVELCPRHVTEEEVVEAFKELVGLSRHEVATHLVNRFGLEDKARARMAEFGVTTPWQSFVQIRLRYYERLLADPEVIRQHGWPHALALLGAVRKAGYKIGLATQSYCEQARHVLSALGLTQSFDFIATRDDVERPKPDPEIYRLVAHELEVLSPHCLVIEDSVSGVQAALAAGMQVIAVSTLFTRESLHASKLLPDSQIIDDPADLASVAWMQLEAV